MIKSIRYFLSTPFWVVSLGLAYLAALISGDEFDFFTVEVGDKDDDSPI